MPNYSEYEFSRTSIFVDQRDGRVYKTVRIGDQIWMAENLNYECKGSKFYDNNPANSNKYGRLYDWETAMKVCPPGWHLPSKEEWDVLVATVGEENTAGKHLKAKSGWNSKDGKSGNGLDTSGFSALPGGYGDSDGSFFNVGLIGGWWSSSEVNADDACLRVMGDDIEYARWFSYGKIFFFSVRCLQD